MATKKSELIANASNTIGAPRNEGGKRHADGEAGTFADAGTVTASATFVPPVAGVTGFGVKVQTAPAGKPLMQASVTGAPALPTGKTGME